MAGAHPSEIPRVSGVVFVGKVTSSISQNDVVLDNNFFGMDGNGDFHQFFHGKDVERITQLKKKMVGKGVSPFMRLIVQ